MQYMTVQPYPFESVPAAAGAPPAMKHAILRALSKDREQRQASVRQFYEELASGGSGVGTSPALLVAQHGGGVHAATPPAAPAYSQAGPYHVGPPPAYTPPAHVAHPTPSGGQTFPTSPQPQAPRPPGPEKRGGKGLIIGLASVAVVLA